MLSALRALIDREGAGAGLTRSLPLPAALGSLRPLAEKLLAGPASREALMHLARLVEVVGECHVWPCAGAEVDALARILSSGPGLSHSLSLRPDRLNVLKDALKGRPWSQAVLRRDLARRLPGADPLGHAGQPPQPGADPGAAIASFRNDHYLRLAISEFGLDDGIPLLSLETVGQELADVADCCVQVALNQALADHQARYGAPVEIGDDGREQLATIVALAMGKYGARELNFCSDIDLVFIYSSDNGLAGKRSLHEFYSGVVRDVVRLLVGAENEEGFPYRVDLRLRPEGSQGPICNALASAESYYETWGGAYDRLAWLKARSAAGDLSLGAQMLKFMQPFVFPRSIDHDVVEVIQELSRRIRAESTRRSLVAGWNVKLDRGGIRDVEFFVQALQLIYAGKQPALQEPATLRALDKLVFLGYISEEERVVLGESYDLYRRIEHRLQLHNGRQTHLLPDHGALREQILTHLGYDLSTVDKELLRRRERVSQIYETLTTVPDAQRPAHVEPPLPWADLDADYLAAFLKEIGFADAEGAERRLRVVAQKPWGPWGRNSRNPRIRALAVPLLSAVASAPDPIAALAHLVSFALRCGSYEGPWLMLAENTPALRLLISLFGTSDFLARFFIAHPEMVDQVMLAGRLDDRRSMADFQQDLIKRLPDNREEGFEICLGEIAKHRDEELLRIGMLDISGDLHGAAVHEQLSDLAEAALRTLYPLIEAQVVERYGEPQDPKGGRASMSVLALGKLGAREMSYGSDLDLIFVYSSEGETTGPQAISNAEFFVALAQRLIRALSIGSGSGPIYAVDTRLRPSGSQGTLVVSRASFSAYHHERADIWEEQALIKARPIAGADDLGESLAAWIERFIYRPGHASLPELAQAINGMREKIERQEKRAFLGAKPTFDLKCGYGGLMDIEFAAQYLQLAYGDRFPQIRKRNTRAALEAAAESGIVSDGDVGILIEGYRFLRQLESRLRIVLGRAEEALPRRAEDLETIARRLSYRAYRERSAGEHLLSDYHAKVHEIRAAYLRVLAIES